MFNAPNIPTPFFYKNKKLNSAGKFTPMNLTTIIFYSNLLHFIVVLSIFTNHLQLALYQEIAAAQLNVFLLGFYKIKLLVVKCMKVGGNGVYSEGVTSSTCFIKNGVDIVFILARLAIRVYV